jgi:hypothetical protein
MVSGGIKLSKTIVEEPMAHAGGLVYTDLFKKNITQKLTLGVVYPNPFRNPINTFIYENKFDLLIYKLNSLKLRSLSDGLIVDYKSSGPQTDLVYSTIHQSLYSFWRKYEKCDSILKFFLSIKGDSLKTIVQNDTIISYNFKLKNFSLKYKENGDQDIVGAVEGILAPKIPYSLIIYKKKEAVYLLTMTPIDRKTLMDPMLLTNLVLNKENN